jgi:hypothetical protein
VAKCGNMSKLPLWNHCGDIKMPYTPVAIAIVVETSKSLYKLQLQWQLRYWCEDFCSRDFKFFYLAVAIAATENNLKPCPAEMKETEKTWKSQHKISIIYAKRWPTWKFEQNICLLV